jgi:phenylacetate-CoA ligase
MVSFPSLEKLLGFVWNNPYSDFYRKKYESAGFQKGEVLNPKNFKNLPFLTRSELEAVAPEQRLFVGTDEVQFVAYTSGTSSQNPLITYFCKVDNYYFDPTLGLGVKRLLITYPPLNKNFGHTFVQQCVQSKNKSIPIFADYQNLANSAVIAKKVEADAIYATPTIALMFVEFLEKYYDPRKIKLLALSSETLTSTRRKQLELAYPNAQIANLYASSEIGQYVLYPCQNIIAEKKNLFHILQPPVLAAEIIDGELVITYANNKAMPLIRYRTGDFFEIVGSNCSCGLKGVVLSWSGKKEVDKIRVSGVEIKVDDVEQMFNPLIGIIGNNYQIHFYESESQKGAVEIIIEVKKSPINNIINPDLIASKVIDHLMNNWQLSPTALLKEAIDRGLFLIPEIKFVEEFSFPTAKTRRLVSHLNE